MSEQQTVGLAAWLTQIWDEEEQLAIKAGGDRWIIDGSIVHENRPHDDVVDWVYDEADEHIAYHDPASVLARIAANRKILAAYQDAAPPYATADQQVTHDVLKDVLRTLAWAHAGQPGYQLDWAD